MQYILLNRHYKVTMCIIVYSSLVFLGQVLDTENKYALICVTKSSLIIIVFPMKIFLLQYYYYYLYYTIVNPLAISYIIIIVVISFDLSIHRHCRRFLLLPLHRRRRMMIRQPVQILEIRASVLQSTSELNRVDHEAIDSSTMILIPLPYSTFSEKGY